MDIQYTYFTSCAMLLSDIPWNIPQVTCIFWYTHEPLGECVYQENTSDEWDISQLLYTTRKCCITSMAQKAQTTVERNWWESQCTMGRLDVIQLNCNTQWEGWVEYMHLIRWFII